ncbi:Mannan endo-1,4-beta-mannosidase 1 [Platanthera zijinensis]|uniref:mannan endo-1,4-beta-mannosidase n=1 Tax=Platanthera zijinensis TaxID=2320716 RepID=A0AAP0B123_9ASPA
MEIKKMMSFLAMLTILLAAQSRHGHAAANNFVVTRGFHFVLGGSPFYANGFNAYWLMTVASDPSQRPKISAAFRQATANGLTVGRTWAFSDGGANALQYSPDPTTRRCSSMTDRVITRANTLTGTLYKDDPTIFAWELINEPRCSSDLSGNTVQWEPISSPTIRSQESISQLCIPIQINGKCIQFSPIPKLISARQFQLLALKRRMISPRLPSSSDQSQLQFLNNWLDSHSGDAQFILRKPLMVTEFGKSSKDAGYSSSQRDALFQTVYSKIYQSAKSGGAAAGCLFWQLLVDGMNSMRDGYEVVLDETTATARIISTQSRQLRYIGRLYARERNIASITCFLSIMLEMQQSDRAARTIILGQGTFNIEQLNLKEASQAN